VDVHDDDRFARAAFGGKHTAVRGCFNGGVPADEGADADLAGLADAGLARWVAEVRQAGGPSWREAGAAALRQDSRRRAAARPPGPALPLVRDLSTADDGRPGLPLRLYRPATEPRPLVLYLHGGGFVLGDLESHDSICRRLALIADVAVLAVDYRRAPEHPGPAAVDDAVTAFGWAQGRPDELGAMAAAGIGLAGDSAGGALALLASVRLRAGGTPAAALLLAYPNADMTLSEPSLRQEGHGWGLEADDVRWSVAQWIPDPARRADAELSPVHAELAGLPPTVIATAEHDPLRDEGRTLARLMRGAGVNVLLVPHPGLVHGFLGLAHISAAAGRAGDELLGRFGRLLREDGGGASR
jgi:acetyl esterase